MYDQYWSRQIQVWFCKAGQQNEPDIMEKIRGGLREMGRIGPECQVFELLFEC